MIKSNFYVSEIYQGALTAFEFLENKRTQWNQRLVLGSRANGVNPGYVVMMTEIGRVLVMMITIHIGYRVMKKTIIGLGTGIITTCKYYSGLLVIFL